MSAAAAAPDASSLGDRAARAAASVARLSAEVAELRRVRDRAAELARRVDAVGGAVDAQTRAARTQLGQRLRAAAAAPDAAEHANVRRIIATAVDEELTRPELASGTGSRFNKAIGRADAQLQTDPHACVRRCGARLYEAWGQLALRCVMFLASVGLLPGLRDSLRHLRPAAPAPGASGGPGAAAAAGGKPGDKAR